MIDQYISHTIIECILYIHTYIDGHTALYYETGEENTFNFLVEMYNNVTSLINGKQFFLLT